MKKLYIAPETSIDVIETEAIMTVSQTEEGDVNGVSTSDTPYSGGEVLSRQSVWDDEE